MLNSIILLGGLVIAFGLGAISPNQEKQDNIQFKLENHKSVEYNDDNEEISLTNYELNNYFFNHLYQSFDLGDLQEFLSLTYDGDNFEFAENNDGAYFWQNSTTPIVFVYDYVLFNAGQGVNLTENYIFRYGSSFVDFDVTDEVLILSFDSNEKYTEGKQVIELDIQANQPSDNIPQVMSDFIGVLISGISQLAGGLANGIVAMASALFLSTTDGQVTGLSLFGGIIAIFAGLALAVGITTKVYNWVTSLGN